MGHTVKGLTEIGCNVVAPGSAKFLFIPDITSKATGAVLIVLIALYIASQIASTLMATASADPNQRRMMLLLPLVIVAFLFRYPAGLLVYWITTNLWTIGQQYFIRRRIGTARRRSLRRRRRIVPTARRRCRRRPRSPAPRWWEPAAVPRSATASAQEEEALGQATMSATSMTRGRGGRRRRRRCSKTCSRRSPTGSISTSRSSARRPTVVLRGCLRGEDVGLFIGRRGQTIDAVQHLAQRIVFHEGPSDVRVVIDADGYRERRAETLRADADDAAEETLRSGRPGGAGPDASLGAAGRPRTPARSRRRGDAQRGRGTRAAVGGLPALD